MYLFVEFLFKSPKAMNIYLDLIKPSHLRTSPIKPDAARGLHLLSYLQHVLMTPMRAHCLGEFFSNIKTGNIYTSESPWRLSLLLKAAIYAHARTHRNVMKAAWRAVSNCTIYSMQEHHHSAVMAAWAEENYQAASPQAWLILLKD